MGLKDVQQVEIQPLKVNGFSQYPNCGDDGFSVSATTVASRAQKFGVGSDGIREWVAGQVFQNCGNATDLQYYGPDQQRPPKVVPSSPPRMDQENAVLVGLAWLCQVLCRPMEWLTFQLRRERA